jgi:hypothetical protein
MVETAGFSEMLIHWTMWHHILVDSHLACIVSLLLYLFVIVIIMQMAQMYSIK